MSDAKMTSPAREPVQIQRATDEILDRLVPVLAAAFGEHFSDADIAQERRSWEVDRIFGAWDGERPVGMCGNLTFHLTTPGGEVPAAGMTLVGVLAGERRRGILRSMMRELIADGRAHDEPVAVLWASEGAIYQRFGFGLATLNGTFELPRLRPAFLRPQAFDGRVRLVDVPEAGRLCAPVYDGLRSGLPGALTRSEAFWAGLLEDSQEGLAANGPKFRAVLEQDGAVVGYVVYRTKAEWDERGPKGRLTVIELVGQTPQAELELWSFCFGMDLFPTVRAVRQPVPHPLLLALAEPRSLGLTVNDGIWLRLVDVGAALAARRYAGPGALVIDVSDAFLPENAGRWRLSVDPRGNAAVEPTEASAQLAADVADLAACYLGTFRPSELARVGRMSELEAGALARADALFRSDRAPWCSTMF
jgi:predicted acetyltransferase